MNDFLQIKTYKKSHMISQRNTHHLYKAVILCFALIIGTSYAAGGIVNPNPGTIQNIINITSGGDFFDTALSILWYIVTFVRLVLN